MLRRCAPFLLAAALAGCASYSTEPSPEAQRAAWEARNLYPQSYRSEILAYMRNYFNDPRNVRDAFVSEPELKPMGLGNRYISCLRYGLRNAAGGTPPGREHVVIFVGGKLDALRDAIIAGRVKWIEHLGDRNHLHVAVEGDDLVTLADQESGLEVGDSVTVDFVRPLFFDNSGNRIAS